MITSSKDKMYILYDLYVYIPRSIYSYLKLSVIKLDLNQSKAAVCNFERLSHCFTGLNANYEMNTMTQFFTYNC